MLCMENVRNNKHIATRTEEVQDIIDRMPTGWTFAFACICGILIFLLVGFGFAVSYPDTVDGEVTISMENASVRLVSATGGRLHLLRNAGEKICTGDVLGYIESGVDYSSFLHLEDVIRQGITESLPSFDKGLAIGELSASYANYIQAYENWYRLKTSNRNKVIRDALEMQVQVDRELAEQMKIGLSYKEQSIRGNQEWFQKDSVLYRKGLISKYEIQQEENDIRSQRESYINARTAHLSQLSDIQQTESRIIQSRIEEEEAIDNALEALLGSSLRLRNDVDLWKERYLFTATENGVLEYLGFWKDNVVVQSGTEVFSIIPQKTSIIGEAVIPANGAGKVSLGMPVNIKLAEYPYDEYGMLTGRVEKISHMTHSLATQSGTINVYRVLIGLPDGLKTNYGITLDINPEAKGVAEIITKPRRLIERLFDNLRARKTK